MAGKAEKLLMRAGAVLVILSLMLTIFNLWDDIRAGRDASEAAASIGSEWKGDTDYLDFPDMEMPTVEIDGISYIGVLSIPETDSELPVISDVSMAGLRKAPCRYYGSAYNDTLVVAAHNYRTHFGRIGELQQDDVLSFTDVMGNVFDYRVAETEILQPYDTEYMKNSKHDLTLFTCTIGGLSRVTVRCDRVDAAYGYSGAGQPAK